MELEYAVEDHRVAYECPVRDGAPMVLDWRAMIGEIVVARARGETIGAISAAFHRGLVEAAVTVARKIGQSRVALSGGCFQNEFLTETLIAGLRAAGLEPCWHRHTPPNDGGIALGQIAAIRYGFHHSAPCA
jgi:hydrogenase maturation protein HypF